MCGIIGMVAKGPVNQDLYDGGRAVRGAGQPAGSDESQRDERQAAA